MRLTSCQWLYYTHRLTPCQVFLNFHQPITFQIYQNKNLRMLHIGTPAGLYLKLLFNLLAIVERNPPRTALEPSPACDRGITGLDFHDGVHTDRDILRPCVVRPRSFADVQVGNADLHEKRHSGSCFLWLRDHFQALCIRAFSFSAASNFGAFHPSK